MSVKETLSALPLLAATIGEAQAADRIEPATLDQAAAECVAGSMEATAPGSTGPKGHFPILKDHLDELNRDIAQLTARQYGKQVMADSFAQAFYTQEKNAVDPSVMAASEKKIEDTWETTDPKTLEGVEKGRKDMADAVDGTYKTQAVLDHFVDAKGKPLTRDAFLEANGMTYEQIAAELRVLQTVAAAAKLKSETGWDCTNAMLSAVENGVFPAEGTRLPDYQKTAFTVKINLYAKAEVTHQTDLSISKHAFVDEHDGAENVVKAGEKQVAGTERFVRRYKADELSKLPALTVNVDTIDPEVTKE